MSLNCVLCLSKSSQTVSLGLRFNIILGPLCLFHELATSKLFMYVNAFMVSSCALYTQLIVSCLISILGENQINEVSGCVTFCVLEILSSFARS